MANYRYLLDTNIVAELIKNPQGVVARKMLAQGLENFCCTSVIVACELRYGAVKKQSPKLSFNVEQVLNSLPVLSLEEPIVDIYAKIRVNLERVGLPIGQHDLLIAAHALCFGLIVVTANEREFSRVEDLVVDNWLID